jgi:hypothetical protein
MEEAQLLETNILPNQNDRPLWSVIAGNIYMHPLAHFSDIYIKRGDHSKANKLQEQSFQLLSDLDDSDYWQGLLIYNQACIHALGGLKEIAIDGLKRALELRPDLTDWSKEDPDFESIREEPKYKNIYEV